MPRRSTVLAGLALCLLVGCERIAAPETERAAAPLGAAVQSGDTAADVELHLRLDAGTVVRAAPAGDAPTVAVLGDAGLFAVAERRGDWHRLRAVDTVAADTGTAGNGERASPGDEQAWVWLSAADAANRAMHLARARGPRPPVAPSAEVLAKARTHLRDGGRETRCGPYRLLTDVDDAAFVAACDRLAAGLDDAFVERYGIAPQDEPAAAILLFARRDGFRAFARARGHGARRGYAAHARASDGYVAIHAEDIDGDRDRLLETLVHELAHLVARRALGDELPRWLSEGLADGLGDSAGESGLEPLEGLRGAEAEAARLAGAYATGRARPIARLVAADADDFDAGVVSYDYEQSAFLVRLLLTDPDLRPHFHAFLADLAAGERYTPELLQRHLGVEWGELDERLRKYVSLG